MNLDLVDCIGIAALVVGFCVMGATAVTERRERQRRRRANTWRLDPDAFELAKAELGIRRPVFIDLGPLVHSAAEPWGWYSPVFRLGRWHSITVAPNLDAIAASCVLWHELQHAAQIERRTRIEGWLAARRYLKDDLALPYRDRQMEVEAWGMHNRGAKDLLAVDYS